MIGQKISIRSLHRTNIDPLVTFAPAGPTVFLGYPITLFLLLLVFVNFVAIGALILLSPYTVIETLEPSVTTMTLLSASFAFTVLLPNPFLGRLSDHVGRRLV